MKKKDYKKDSYLNNTDYVKRSVSYYGKQN